MLEKHLRGAPVFLNRLCPSTGREPLHECAFDSRVDAGPLVENGEVPGERRHPASGALAQLRSRTDCAHEILARRARVFLHSMVKGASDSRFTEAEAVRNFCTY